MKALHAAQLDYEALCRATPGVTREEVELDLMRLELIATSCAEAARKSWREYRATHDAGSRPPFELGTLTRLMTDAVAETLGFSREAATVLDELAKAEFA